MDNDDVTTSNHDLDAGTAGATESWLAEQARLLLLEDGTS